MEIKTEAKAHRGWGRNRVQQPLFSCISLATLEKKWFIVFVSRSVCVLTLLPPCTPHQAALFLLLTVSLPAFLLLMNPPHHRTGPQNFWVGRETFSFLCNYEKQRLRHHRERKFSQNSSTSLAKKYKFLILTKEKFCQKSCRSKKSKQIIKRTKTRARAINFQAFSVSVKNEKRSEK